jgi:hypothetical protein
VLLDIGAKYACRIFANFTKLVKLSKGINLVKFTKLSLRYARFFVYLQHNNKISNIWQRSLYFQI